MKQKFSSANTSINSTKIPSLFNKVKFEENSTILDIGGGKFDNTKDYFSNNGYKFAIYDKFNRTAEYNNSTLDIMSIIGGANYVTLSNVLNVISEKEIRLEVLRMCKNNIKKNGTTIITVYEGNKSGIGKQSKADCYQLNQKTSEYINEVKEVFSDVSIKSNVIYARF